jgi:hypothetical protein
MEIVTYQDTAIQNYADLENVAKAMVSSGYFTDSTKVSQAIVKIMAGREIGLGPFGSMNGIHIIQGKPAFGANIMAGKVKASGRYNYRVTEMSDSVCTIEFMEYLNGSWITTGVSSFSIADAKKAGTKNLDKFPRNMLFARAMSNGVRWYCPDVMNGSVVYTPEELGADVDQDGNVINVEVVDQVVIPEPESEPEVVVEQAKSNGNKWARPMSPEVLKEALQIKSAKANPATEKQINLTRVLLLEHFADREDERHQAQEYLTGHKSFKDIEPTMISAILDWMKPEKATDGSGAYVLGKDAKIELTMVARKFMEDLGQQALAI